MAGAAKSRWTTIFRLLCRLYGRDQLGKRLDQESVRVGSLGVTIACIIFVLVIVAAIVISELTNVNLVKHGTKQVLVNALRAMKSMLDGIDLRSAPLDDKDIRVNEMRCRAHIHYWRERGKINHHPLVPAAQLVK
jgi:hypothetical protein